jgi:hypothetical protein
MPNLLDVDAGIDKDHGLLQAVPPQRVAGDRSSIAKRASNR